MRTKRTYYKDNFHFVCPVCKAHVKTSEANYTKWGKRCEECYQQDRTAIYPYNTYKDVYNAIMDGTVVKYKIAEGFFVLGQLVTIGIGQAKQSLPALTNENGQVIQFGSKEVMAGIKRTYPQFWREVKQEKPNAKS